MATGDAVRTGARLAAAKKGERGAGVRELRRAASSAGASSCIRASVRRTLGPATLTVPTTPPVTGWRIAAAIAEVPGAELSTTMA